MCQKIKKSKILCDPLDNDDAILLKTNNSQE